MLESSPIPFDTVGRPLVAGGDRPFLLDRATAWLVRSGTVDVFSTALDEGRPAARRRHLFRVESDHLLLGIRQLDAARPYGLLAVGSNGAELVELDQDELAAIARDHSAVAPLVDHWVELVSSQLGSDLHPEDCTPIRAGDRAAAEEGALRVRPDRGTLWVRHEEGRSLFAGRGDLEVNGRGLTPVSHEAWLELQSGARISAQSTSEVMATDELWKGLDRLHELLLDALVAEAAERVRAEREQLRRRMAAERQVFIGACSEIASAVDGAARPEVGSGLPSSRPASGILQACRRVGALLEIEVREPPPSLGDSLGDPIALIARASRFRIRQVVLKGEWWKGDSGPFVAFLGEAARPVALLPDRRSGYRIEDPETGDRRRVDEAVAEELQPLAYMLYRPMGERVMGALQLLRFGLTGAHRDLVSVLVLSAVIGLISMVPPLAIQAIFNDAIPSADRGALLQIGLGLLVAALATLGLDLVRSRTIVRIEGKMGNALQSGVWDRLLSVPMPFFRPYTSGELAHRTLSIEAIRRIISGPVMTTLLGGFFSLMHLGLLFYYSAELARWATLIIAFAIVVVSLTAWAQMGSEEQVVRFRSRLSGTLLQFLTGISKLRVAGAEVHAFAVWAERFSKQRRYQHRSRTVMNLLVTFNSGLPVIGTLVIFAFAAHMLIGEGSLRTGDFLAFLSSFTICLTGVLQASAGLVQATKMVPAYRQAAPILHAVPEVDASKTDPGQLRGGIDVRHLSFRYQTDGPLILNDVSLEVKPGEFVAVVGPSGSGKSTLLRVVLGFETPESGTVYFDSHELSGLDLQAVRSQIGTVLQNGRLTSGDLFTNIVGSSRATLDDAWEAAKMAGLDQDIGEMPMGMNTVINEGASTLSGGQRQRLLIARALVHKPRVVFFDEATSALDNRTQAVVTSSLEAIQATRVVIAHRLSTVQRAERIYVLEGGRLVEQGSYADLLALDGVFADLARRQMA